MASQSITLRLIQKPRPEHRILISQEEYGDDLLFNLQDKNGNAFDLTDKVPVLQVWSKGMKPFLNIEIETVDGVNNQCKYTIAKEDFANTGTFYLRIIAKTNDSKRQVFETVLLVVQQ